MEDEQRSNCKQRKSTLVEKLTEGDFFSIPLFSDTEVELVPATDLGIQILYEDDFLLDCQ